MSEQQKNLVWKAMYEADVTRRYHGQMCDRLRRLNMWMAVSAWGLALVASVLSVWAQVPLYLSAAVLLVGAATITLRDVLRIPERLAHSHYTLVGLNEEYDRMRLLWETDGGYRPLAEHESFRNISRLHDVTTETLDREMLQTAEKEAERYYDQIRKIATSKTEVDRKAGLPLGSPPGDDPKNGKGDKKKGGDKKSSSS